ncbi:hypothetical protein [Stenotrophomonas rhizophila]|uniref:hypothetical protein n=1 Tax=Stenotrophomonas rhizophila TaxID=216778 RepID=UPI001E5135C6|nr:hypothetical protein [Stenotrophomonas rhizophila]MCC7635587.1 hypothetical protein [Stenotrophomonas rhizophila]MCC7664204.1 hypothetical protein [Stenotrophomonas rhizophila]
MSSSSSRPFWILAILAWLAMVTVYISSGFQPDYWPPQNDDRPAPYPLAQVIVFCIITALEIALGTLIARPWKLPRLRRLSALLIVLLLWSVPWAMAGMHQPPVRGSHMNWLLLFNAAVLLAICTDATINTAGVVRRWIRTRRLR